MTTVTKGTPFCNLLQNVAEKFKQKTTFKKVVSGLCYWINTFLVKLCWLSKVTLINSICGAICNEFV